MWYVEVAETHLINLTFVDFLTRNNDKVLVYDGDVHGKLLLNHSGNSLPQQIISSSNKIAISFEVGKSSILAKGFNAIYSTVNTKSFNARYSTYYDIKFCTHRLVVRN